MDRRKVLVSRGVILGATAIAAIGVLTTRWLMSSPRDGADVTDTQYNGGYVRNRVYTTIEPLGVYYTPPSVSLPVTQYYLDGLPSPKYASMNAGLSYVVLPAGSRIRFDKMLWLQGHFSWNGTGGAMVVAYGTILNGPCTGRVVNLVYVSKQYDLVGKCMPSPAILR